MSKHRKHPQDISVSDQDELRDALRAYRADPGVVDRAEPMLRLDRLLEAADRVCYDVDDSDPVDPVGRLRSGLVRPDGPRKIVHRLGGFGC